MKSHRTLKAGKPVGGESTRLLFPSGGVQISDQAWRVRRRGIREHIQFLVIHDLHHGLPQLLFELEVHLITRRARFAFDLLGVFQRFGEKRMKFFRLQDLVERFDRGIRA